jgi:hypothetical protein
MSDDSSRQPDLFGSSLKTCEATYRLDSPQSSAIFERMVTERSGEYSARLSAVRRTTGNGYSSLDGWRTPSTQDPGITIDRLDVKPGQRWYDKETGRNAQCGLTQQVQVKNWNTPNVMDILPPKSQAALEHEYEHRTGRANPNNLLDQIAVREGQRQWPTCSVPNGGRTTTGDPNNPRKKQIELAHAVKSEASAWPTPSSRDYKDTPGMAMSAVNPDGSDRDRTDQLARAVYNNGRPDPEKNSIRGSHLELWPTVSVCGNHNRKGASETSQDGLSTKVKAWSTPRAEDAESCGMRHGRGVADTLTAQTRIWQTPASDSFRSRGGDRKDEMGLDRKAKQSVVQHAGHPHANPDSANWATPRTPTGGAESAERKKELGRMESGGGDLASQTQGKLNPRWVETLMGVPIGWCMPSCTNPVIIEPMNCVCLETE